jgi:hypothetical protein
VIFYRRAEQPVAHQWLTEQVRAAGVRTGLQEASLTNIFASVAAGLALSVLVSSFKALLRPPGVRFAPLDSLAVDLIMTWPVGPEPGTLSAFRRELSRALQPLSRRLTMTFARPAWNGITGLPCLRCGG